MQTKKSLTTKASELGSQAFKDGKVCIPVQDKDLMNLIKNSRDQIGTKVGSSTFIFKAWSNGWMKSQFEFNQKNKIKNLLKNLPINN